ncbi:NAD-glutamate dehydrogenase [Aquibaculum arenosum]|uniref:NAD-glutamate dehydrogenase n=1 Tax=Aquibaculum arenosum TaxID=3032591 RepID=A0ABT5YI90_9PROT|nr:NAD-glutamate dehydrogenase [Fodinicurvata sp. CAU 1616]MDF2094654.1 NAD-glutamate dehydrogenase [Fodinicurvata sp. CAU 1616]
MPAQEMGEDMAKRARKQCNELVETALEAVLSRGAADNCPALEVFARAFLADAPPEDVRHETPDNLAGMALDLFRFARQRDEASQAKIKVYDPTPEQEGWSSAHSAVAIVNNDMPFLVDSVTAELNRLGAEVFLVVHPILLVRRDAEGRLDSLAEATDPDADGRPESHMLLLISEQPRERHAEIAAGLEAVLADVRNAVEDWRLMRQRCRELLRELERDPPSLPREEIIEGIDFLEWLDDDHFTYLGYREYAFRGKGAEAVADIDAESGLGILRDPDYSIFAGLRSLGKLPSDVRAWVKSPQLVRITKANRRATVHRRVPMDTIAVKRFDRAGHVIGERVFVGLFTSTAYSRSPRQIPLLRRKVDDTIAAAGFVPGSHNGKALLHILETYPRDELFQIDAAELHQIAEGILHLQERQRTALFVRRDPFERFVSAMIFVPRDRFDTNLRLKLQNKVAEAYAGRVESFGTQIGESPLARLHVIVRTERGRVPKVDVEALESELAEVARSWIDLLEQGLVQAHGEEQGLRRFAQWQRAFPASYQEDFKESDAVADIAKIERLMEGSDLEVDLYRPQAAPRSVLRFKVYIRGRQLALSDMLPMLENMGLRVLGEVPYAVRPGDGEEEYWIHDFDLERPAGEADLEAVRDAFHEVFSHVWFDRMENDGFNRLVLAAGLRAREIQILRAYCKYLRQAQIPFSQAYMEATLAANPDLTRKLAELFMQRFDPELQESGGAAAQGLVDAVQAGLEEVANLDEDRIIRRYLNLILSTLRTNYFQQAEDGSAKPTIAFKLDAGAIEELPAPRPYREIFVYSPRVEGVHLRFGSVARGGLRWSDRKEDFRTEVLGLVKAQQVKNAVIVPVGAKGGFVAKRLPPPEAGRDAWMAEGVEAYKAFIRALLDVTDNLDGDRVVPPERVVRYDADDPYMVVAADKGTATFSDIANGVAVDYGFWLDDAFASGGSAGYDHKAMGITARGAWESVKRHFRELGRDIQTEDFTVIGCGDMSGDVFGNGMLLSRHIKLVGAFNHLHIFVDPDPDPAASWVERKRLFELPRSAWTDYDAKLISKGGGIFDRKAKSVPVSEEMRRCFGLEADSVTPNQLISAMLKAEVDLLWFGGIGTYVKARDESHPEVGDRANDSIRVNGNDLRARVIGEGANLGMTQRGRIEYALAGGRLNTDAIDNSAGVDCSDHEVNIKVLLGAAAKRGRLARKRRDALLERMTDEVASLVLRDNYLQSQTISVTNMLGTRLLDRLGRFMRALERAGQLNRALEFLPDEETLAERVANGVGLTRPEIAVLLAYAKLDLYQQLLASDMPDDPWLERDLFAYFPEPLQQDFAADIRRHRLRRELVATQVSNELVNRLGITFIHEAREKTGLPSSAVARAFVATRDLLNLPALWHDIEALDNRVPARAQIAMLLTCGRATEHLTSWLLRSASQVADIQSCVERYAAGLTRLSEALPGLLADHRRHLLESEAAGFSEQGVPEPLATRVATVAQVATAADVVRLADECGRDLDVVAAAYFRVGTRFGFDWLREAAAQLPRDLAWNRLAITALIDDLYESQARIAAAILAKAGDYEDRMAEWLEPRALVAARSDQLIGELQAMAAPNLAMLTVANRQLKTLTESS